MPTRFYDGSLSYKFEPELKEPEIAPDTVLAAIDTFSNAAMRLASPVADQEDTYATIRKDLLEWAGTAKARIAAHQNLKTTPGAAALTAVHNEATGKGRPETADIVQAFLAAITEPMTAAAVPPVLQQGIGESEEHLPVFIYIEN